MARFLRNWSRNGQYRDSRGRYMGKNSTAEDDYSENSGGRKYYESGYPRFSTDRVKPESLNGPVIIVQEGRKKDGK